MRYFGAFGTGKFYQIIDKHKRSEQVVLPKSIETRMFVRKVTFFDHWLMSTLGKPSKKINTIFYDIESISFATYPPYLIMT